MNDLRTPSVRLQRLRPEELGVDELPVDELCADEPHAGELHAGELCAGELCVEELWSGGLPVDDPRRDDLPFGEPTVDDRRLDPPRVDQNGPAAARTRRAFLRLGASAVVAGPVGTFAQPARAEAAWPSRPIRLVVPFPPGSSPDVIGRLIADPLAAALGQAVVIDNKPGAGGNIGTASVAKAPADGHTLLFTIQGPLVTAPMLVRHLNYDPARDFEPVTLVATSPNVLVVDPKLGARTLADFVRLAKSRPGELNYGSVGTGSAAHLAMELFKARAGIDLVHVPYQGFPQVVAAMLAGQVQAGFMVPASAVGQIRAGKLAALGVTSPGRSAVLPELQSFVELGYAGFEAISWQAVLAPAGTPKPVVARLASELIRIIRSDDIRTRMLGQYFSAVGTAPEALAALMRTDRDRWAQVIKAAGVQPE